MNRCASCKHWDRHDSRFISDELRHWGTCKLAESDGGYPEHQRTLAYAADYECYRAGLTTHETFGCVQWEPSEQALIDEESAAYRRRLVEGDTGE